MIRPTATKRPVRMMLLALVALGGTLLALSSAGPAAAATTFTVNRAGDAGDRNIDGLCDSSRTRGSQCTLRAAIQEANAPVNPGSDTINFNIGGTASVKTISPASELPDITEAVTINGYTQQGARANTRAVGNNAVLKIELDGGRAGFGGGTGLEIEASNVTVKGLVINRWSLRPVHINGGSNNRIQGNFLGTNPAGNLDRSTGVQGVLIHQVSSVPVSNNLVGGTAPQARNLISGADVAGVAVFEDNNRIEGNYIGTKADGNGDLGNSGDGVTIFGANNTVGGTASGAGNRIAHNGGAGVAISNGTGNRTLSNLIFRNGKDGVVISSSTGNHILSNRIFSNSGLGIDLGDDDITNNDRDRSTTPEPDADIDTGANNLQDFPRMITARRNPTTGLTTITGELESVPSKNYLIEVFLTEGSPDTSGHGEGQRLLGKVVVRDPDGDGKLPFIIADIEGLEREQQVSATATRLDTSTSPATPIETSEFAQNHNVT